MPLSNATLASKLDTVATGWQQFVDETITWTVSQNPTETFTDPVTGDPVAIKTPYQLQQDYDTILGPVGSQLSDANDNWIASQAMLTDALAAQAAADAARIAAEAAQVAAELAETNAETSATNAGDSATTAQAWAEQPENIEITPASGTYSALHHAAKAAADAVAAALSETNAGNSATAAGTSETNAGNSAVAAALSETNAGNSETAAALSETNAGISETNAAASETAAGLSETAAGLSETAAGTSASNASTSASNAATSETNAGNSATAAGISETNAAASETAAGISETNALSSEGKAATSEALAEKWAEELEDVEVTTGAYSAYHWAKKAQASASGDITLDASKIVSGTFVDARIAETNVTQHEAALTVATSQITGLESELDILRLALAGEFIHDWNAVVTGGAEPTRIEYTANQGVGPRAIKAEYAWTNGKVTGVELFTSENNGTNWTSLGTATITYTGDDVTGWTWSAAI